MQHLPSLCVLHNDHVAPQIPPYINNCIILRKSVYRWASIWLIIRRDGSGDLLIARDTAGAMWEGVGSETSSDSNLQYHGGFLRFFPTFIHTIDKAIAGELFILIVVVPKHIVLTKITQNKHI